MIASELLAEATQVLAEGMQYHGLLRENYYSARCAGKPELRAAVAELDSAPDAPAVPELHHHLDRLAILLDCDTQDDAGPLDPPLGATVGPYCLQDVLGSGGMGRVYRAIHQGYDGIVALKVLHSSGTEMDKTTGMSRLQREARLLARCKHPGIAQIYFLGSLASGAPYFAMEYVEGQPITEHCEEHKLKIRERLQLFREVCEATQAAHEVGVIHRDLKPSNILVRDDGAVKLLDFGIAEAYGERDVVRSGYISVAYAPPEHADESSTQTDVYSLGVLLVELLLGELPFSLSGRSPHELRAQLLTEGLRPLSDIASESEELRPWLRGLTHLQWRELDAICLKATRREAKMRYSSVAELGREVTSFLASKPVQAMELVGARRSAYLAERFLARHRGAAALSLVSALLLIVLVAAYTWRLREARNAAVAHAEDALRLEDFVLQLFTKGDAPTQKDATIESALEQGVKRARALNTNPAEQAELLHTLGSVYQGLRDFEKSEELLSSALTERSRLFGADSPASAKTLLQMAALRDDEGHSQEAVGLAERALGIDRRKLPPDDPETLAAETELGDILIGAGEDSKCVRILGEVVRKETGRAALLPDLSKALNDLSIAELDLGHLDRARSLNQEVLAIDRQLRGDRHPDIADELMTASNLDVMEGEYKTAEAEAREALSIDQEWFKPGHPEIAAAQTALGMALARQKRDMEALVLLLPALQTEQLRFHDANSHSALTLDILADVEDDLGDIDKSFDYYRQAVEQYRGAYEDKSYQLAIPLRNMAGLYLKKHDFKQAEEAAREAVDIQTKSLPPNDKRLLVSRLYLGRALLGEHLYSQAEPLLTRTYQNAAAAGPREQDKREQARGALIELYSATGRPAMAESCRLDSDRCLPTDGIDQNLR